MNKRIDKRNRGCLRFKGFTLIELLVVIAIIALLLAILIPALKKVKRKAATAVCLTNTKNLSLGWYMYQEDNDGFIVGGAMSKKTSNGTPIGWIRKPRTADGAERNWWYSGEVTDEDEIRGIEAGSLFPYIKTPKIMHCPADNIRMNFFDPSDNKSFASYTVPACLNGAGYGGPVLTRFGKIRNPSAKYNFIEAAEQRPYNGEAQFMFRANKGEDSAWGFVCRGYSWRWWGPLAINHGDSSVFGFCDGHSEVRKWRDEFTLWRVEKLTSTGNGTYGYNDPTPPGQIDDIGFMARGWALGK